MTERKDTRQRDIIIFAAVIILIGIGFYLYKPLDEWSGDTVCVYNDAAKKKVALPLAISRIFFYQSGESGTRQTWIAFSGDKNAIGQYLAGRLKVTPAEGKNWPGDASERDQNPIPPPSRAAWRNWGYWNIPADASGSVFHKKLGQGSMDVFYDTKNQRLYVHFDG